MEDLEKFMDKIDRLILQNEELSKRLIENKKILAAAERPRTREEILKYFGFDKLDKTKSNTKLRKLRNAGMPEHYIDGSPYFFISEVNAWVKQQPSMRRTKELLGK